MQPVHCPRDQQASASIVSSSGRGRGSKPYGPRLRDAALPVTTSMSSLFTTSIAPCTIVNFCRFVVEWVTGGGGEADHAAGACRAVADPPLITSKSSLFTTSKGSRYSYIRDQQGLASVVSSSGRGQGPNHMAGGCYTTLPRPRERRYPHPSPRARQRTLLDISKCRGASCRAAVDRLFAVVL